jgi:GAG-pre-integrase domain
MGHNAPIEGIGTIVLNINSQVVSIPDILYVPQLTYNLLCGAQLIDRGTQPVFSKTKCDLMRDGKVVAVAPRFKNTYLLKTSRVSAHELKAEPSVALATSALTVEGKHEVWHQRLGHPGEVKQCLMINGAVNGIPADLKPDREHKCDVCELTKSMKTISREAPKPAKGLLNRVFVDF